MKFFTKQKKYRYFGEVILGFGLLFFGMTVMKLGLAPIKNDPSFIEFFTKFDPSSASGLILCVFVGAVLTILVQSSSATIGLTMTLATQGLLPFPGAMALVLGENIGTTITAELATIGSANINTPIAALAKVRSEIIRMAETAARTLKDTIQRIEDRDYKKLSKWKRIENYLDDMQKEITSYLTRIFQSDVSESEAREISSLMRMTNNIGRIGDSVENIAQLTEKIIEDKMQFTQFARADLKRISEKAIAFIDLVTLGIHQPFENFMEQAEEMENMIDLMREEMRQGHISRLCNGECILDPGMVFVDLLSNFEKIGDYCYNIAQAVVGIK